MAVGGGKNSPFDPVSTNDPGIAGPPEIVVVKSPEPSSAIAVAGPGMVVRARADPDLFRNEPFAQWTPFTDSGSTLSPAATRNGGGAEAGLPLLPQPSAHEAAASSATLLDLIERHTR